MSDYQAARPDAVAGADSTDVVGRRIGALIVDGLLLAVVFIVVGLVSGGGHSANGRAGVTLGQQATAIFVLITLAYFFVCEATTGQTLGKRVLGIRVATLDGRRASAGSVLLRTVLRLVDALPFLYLVGLISVVATGRNRRQRLGDLAAGTAVVRA